MFLDSYCACVKSEEYSVVQILSLVRNMTASQVTTAHDCVFVPQLIFIKAHFRTSTTQEILKCYRLMHSNMKLFNDQYSQYMKTFSRGSHILTNMNES